MGSRENLVSEYKKLWNDKGRKCNMSDQELANVEIELLESLVEDFSHDGMIISKDELVAYHENIINNNGYGELDKSNSKYFSFGLNPYLSWKSYSDNEKYMNNRTATIEEWVEYIKDRYDEYKLTFI